MMVRCGSFGEARRSSSNIISLKFGRNKKEQIANENKLCTLFLTTGGDFLACEMQAPPPGIVKYGSRNDGAGDFESGFEQR